MKIYELAKELNLTSVALLDKLSKEHNMSFKNHMQSLSAKEVDQVRSFFNNKKTTKKAVKKKSTTVKKKLVRKKPQEALPPEEVVEEKPILRTGIVRRRVVKKEPVALTPPVKKSEKSSKSTEMKSPDLSSEDKIKSPPPTGTMTSHHIRPGLVAGESQDVLKQLNENIIGPEVEEKKKQVKKAVLAKDSSHQQFRATDFRKREVIFQPKKKRLPVGMTSKKTQLTTPKSHKRLIKMYDNSISIEEIAHQLGVKKKILLQKIKKESLFSDGSIPSSVDSETAEVIASLYNFKLKNMMRNREDVITSLFFGDLSAEKKHKPPVVTVMGHVNHGKTTLLDHIRKSRVASQEAGGITQHIGAYSVPVGKNFVTFIDTPGHAAFTSMRARGAKVTDIVVIVVAADDGIQPQTVEAINHAKNAKVPIIVAINKMDLDSANVEQTKKQLADYELVPEEWGGDTIFCPISALKGDGIKELLEHIQLVSEVYELKANPKRSALGVIIESRLEKGRGWVMTLLVQDGTLKSGQIIIAGDQVGRVRQMTNDIGRAINSIGPGMPVEISGFTHSVEAGETFYVVKSEKEARRLILDQKSENEEGSQDLSIEELLMKVHKDEVKKLNVILKTDVVGSMEAIKYSLEKLKTSEVETKIIHSNMGTLNESDVLLASTVNAAILCFNVGIDSKAQKIIKKTGVNVKSYTVIYELLKDVEVMMAGLLDPDIQESFGGQAEVQQVFPISNVGVIAGCKVIKGKINNSQQMRLIRDNTAIYTGKISSLKRFKHDAKEVSEGQECGIGVGQYKDVKPGDIVETFTQTEIKKESLQLKKEKHFEPPSS